MTSPAVVARPRRQTPAPDLRLIERPTRQPARVRPAVVLAFAVVLVFSTLIAAAIVHSMLVSGQAQLDDITTETRTEQEALLREELELAKLQSPSSITREAERMGMVPTQSDNWLAADPGASGPAPEVPAPSTDDAEMAGAAVDEGGPTP